MAVDATVRDATEADAAAIAGVHVRSWQSAYRGLIADEILGGLSIDQRRERWLGRLRDEAGVGPIPFTLVAERDGAVVGFCSVRRLDDDADATIGALYLEPGRLRAGTGTALLVRSLRRLHRAGLDHVVLWVLAANHGARAFYERFGFTPDGSRETFAGAPEIRMRTSLASSEAVSSQIDQEL